MNKYRKGYTLVELLAALALLVAVVGVGYSIYIMGVRGYIVSVKKMEIQQNVRSAASYIQRRLLTASEQEVAELYIDGLKTLKVGNEYFNLKDTTLRVNLEYSSSERTFNPLAEGITEFSFKIEGKRVEVTVAGGVEGKDDYFAVTFEVLLRH
nr:MAG: hypothetical protein DIU64_11850 [Caldicoprobacter oshimai]